MLLAIELENFASIEDKIRLDFRAGNINSSQSMKLKDNIIDWKGQKILKTIGLFGPNASGKTSIIRSIRFCCMMVLKSHLHNENTSFNFQPFKFNGGQQKPSRFYVNFVCDNIEYEYEYTLTTTEILEESLYYYPNNRRAKVFERKNGQYTFGTKVLERPNDVVLATSNKNLFLSRASSMNRELAKVVYRFFLNTFLLDLVPLTNTSIEKNKKLWLRQVIVPGINDDEKHIEKLREFVKDIPNVERIELLPYHSMAKDKYNKLGLEYKLDGGTQYRENYPEYPRDTDQYSVEKAFFTNPYIALYRKTDNKGNTENQLPI